MDKWKLLREADLKNLKNLNKSEKLLDRFNRIKRKIKFSSEYIVILVIIKAALLLFALHQFLQNEHAPAINISVFVASICSFIFYMAYVRNMLKRSEEQRKNTDDLKRHVQSAIVLVLGAICGILSTGLLFISIIASAPSTERLSAIIIKAVSLSILLITATFEVYTLYSAIRKNKRVMNNVLKSWKTK